MRSMLLLHSPRLPGVCYKVEMDAGTAQRLRAIIQAEVIAGVVQGTEDVEEERGPSNRL